MAVPKVRYGIFAVPSHMQHMFQAFGGGNAWGMVGDDYLGRVFIQWIYIRHGLFWAKAYATDIQREARR